MKPLLAATLLCAASLSAPPAKPTGPLAPLAFLQGTWQANNVHGDSGAEGAGDYTFQLKLAGHLLVRHGAYTRCKGPADFDCDHSDRLYIYSDGAPQSLHAIYFDNEGHVIPYAISTPAPDTAVFLSEASTSKPQFRLTYALKAGIMSGKFEIKMPGHSQWHTYLEWSGGKKEK